MVSDHFDALVPMLSKYSAILLYWQNANLPNDLRIRPLHALISRHGEVGIVECGGDGKGWEETRQFHRFTSQSVTYFYLMYGSDQCAV